MFSISFWSMQHLCIWHFGSYEKVINVPASQSLRCGIFFCFHSSIRNLMICNSILSSYTSLTFTQKNDLYFIVHLIKIDLKLRFLESYNNRWWTTSSEKFPKKLIWDKNRFGETKIKFISFSVLMISFFSGCQFYFLSKI